jgi:hypothetical protein
MLKHCNIFVIGRAGDLKKVKFILEQAMKAQRGSRCMAVIFL